jgi:hypothetical protein
MAKFKVGDRVFGFGSVGTVRQVRVRAGEVRVKWDHGGLGWDAADLIKPYDEVARFVGPTAGSRTPAEAALCRAVSQAIEAAVLAGIEPARINALVREYV